MPVSALMQRRRSASCGIMHAYKLQINKIISMYLSFVFLTTYIEGFVVVVFGPD